MKTGRKEKDAPIKEGFNKKKKYKDFSEEEKNVARSKRRAKIEADRKIQADDEKSANQLLADMRWVYRQVNGRKKLKELIKGDDKQFVFMVKELMKIEAAKILKTKDGDTSSQTVFVVLKGLDEEKKYLVDDAVNMKQIQHAIQPESGEFEPEPEVEKMEVTL